MSNSNNGIGIEYDADNFPIAYECQQVVKDNPLSLRNLVITFFYDLSYQTSIGMEKARQQFENLLLLHVARQYGLLNGEACLSPATSDFWMVRASSSPPDAQNLMFDKCSTIVPTETESCVSFEGKMTGFTIGPDDTADLIDFIAKELKGGVVTAGTQLRVNFLGTTIDMDAISGGRDNLNPATNVVDPVQMARPPQEGDRITAVGALLITGLSVGILGILLVLWKLRRKRNQQWQQHPIMATAETSRGYGKDSGGDGGGGVVFDPPRITITSDDAASELPKDYSFEVPDDMGNAMKNELMGVHSGPSRVSSKDRDESELSESDVDSWAQTDATLGSIEHRLEPITAEV